LQCFVEKFKTLKHKTNSVVPYGGTLVKVSISHIFARQWNPQEPDNLKEIKGHSSTFSSWLRFKFDSQKRGKNNFFVPFSLHRLGGKLEVRFSLET